MNNNVYLYIVTSDHFECLEMILDYNYQKRSIQKGRTSHGYVNIACNARFVLEGKMWLNERNDELAKEIFITYYTTSPNHDSEHIQNKLKVVAAGVKED